MEKLPEPSCFYDLKNRVSLVTGAAGAIGGAICRKLLQSNSRVFLTDLPGAALEELTRQLRENFGERIMGWPLDVTSEQSVAGGVAAARKHFGRLDIAVINAGIAHVASLKEMTLTDFQRLEKVNVEGTLLLLKELAKHFEEQATGGDIVFISTKNVFAPGASFGAYSATKAAGHQLARIASLELARLDVRVNMVSPDAVFSDRTRPSGLWQQIGPERMKARGLDEAGLREYYRQRNLLKISVTAEEVANAVLFFVSRQTPTTGATLPVDGGLPEATPR
ncbi:MAG TPA: SDR family NAD(P)-dependent oxidoreductase [bacterium]|nr:SDR family NAD(P)-dependent oxidoreductase [bacterium]